MIYQIFPVYVLVRRAGRTMATRAPPGNPGQRRSSDSSQICKLPQEIRTQYCTIYILPSRKMYAYMYQFKTYNEY